MKILKNTLTWIFSFFNVSVWYDKPTELETLLSKLEKFKLQEEAYQLQLLHHDLVINEAIQTVVMVVSLGFLIIVHVDKLWMIIDKIKARRSKNKKK
jgi:hypothetical protein